MELPVSFKGSSVYFCCERKSSCLEQEISMLKSILEISSPSFQIPRPNDFRASLLL